MCRSTNFILEIVSGMMPVEDDVLLESGESVCIVVDGCDVKRRAGFTFEKSRRLMLGKE